MEVRWATLIKYLADAAAEDLAADYRAKGWKVSIKETLNNVQADLVARKGTKLLIFEFKTPLHTSEKNAAITALRRFIKTNPNARLKLVLVRPPRPVAVEITNLSQTLMHLCHQRYDRLDVAELASNVVIDELHDIALDEVLIQYNSTRIKGSASLGVTLEYGPDDDGVSMSDSYPLEFDLTLRPDLTVDDVSLLRVDVSSFYGTEE